MNEELNPRDLSTDKDKDNTSEQLNPESDIDDIKLNRRRRRIWFWVSTILLITLGSGFTYGWFFIQKKLAPQVEKSLMATFDRPIKLGKVEQFTFNGLRFGTTEIPATANDPDRATVQAIDVDFDPLLFLTTLTLKLDLTLIQPDVYIEQNEKKEWVSTKIIQQEKKGPIKIDLEKIAVEDGEAILVPRNKEGKLGKQVPLIIKSGDVSLADSNQQIFVNLNGGFSAQDEFNVTAKTNLTEQTYQVSLNTKNTDIPTITNFISLPVTLEKGKLTSSVEVEGKGKEIPSTTGIAQIENGTMVIPNVPQPVTDANLEVRFKGKEAQIVRFTSLFGQIPTIASGTVDFEKGWNVTAASDFNFSDLFNTFKVKKFPVNLIGGANAVAQITGPLTKPIITTEIKSNQPWKIDKVSVKEFKANALITTEKITINSMNLTPILGGNITGKGTINLKDKKDLKIDLNADNIPAGAIALLYQPNLAIPVGLFNGKGQIIGTLDKPKDIAFTGNGNAKVADGTILLKNIKVAQGKWQSEVEAQGLQAEQLLNRIERKIPQGVINGKFQLGGDLKDLGLKGININGTGNLTTSSGSIDLSSLSLNNGQLEANLNAVNVNVNSLLSLSRPIAYQEPINGTFNIRSNVSNPENLRFIGITNVAGGSVRIEGELAGQNLTGTIYTANLKTNQVSPQLPDALLTSNFTFTGNLGNFNLEGIKGNGGGKLELAGGNIYVDGNVRSGEFIGTVNTTGIQLNKLLPQIPSGVFNSRFKVESDLSNLSPDKLNAKANGEINIAGGIVTVDSNITDGALVADVNTVGVQVSQLLPQLPTGKLNSQVNVQTNLSDLSVASINANGKASLVSLGGRIDINNLSLKQGQWQGNVIAQGVELAQVPQMPNRLTEIGGQIGGDFQLAGNLENLTPNGILATGEGKLNIAGGAIAAKDVELNQGKFQALITSKGVQLTRINSELEGNLNGEIALTGDVNNLNPTGITAQGNINLTEGVAPISEPIMASIGWDGKTLTTKTEAGETLQLEGSADVNLEKPGLAAVEQMDFDVAANNIDLAKLPLPIPQQVEESLAKNNEEIVTGKASFNGTIAGNLQRPEIQGDVSLKNLTLPVLKFDEQLTGTVAMTSAGAINLDLKGVEDKIQLTLGNNYEPENFLLKVDSLEVKGEKEEDILTVVTNDVPLELVKKAALIYSLPINPTLLQRSESGFVAEDFQGSVSAQLAVNWPSLTSKKALPLFDAEAKIKDIDIQQLLIALQIFEYSDFSRGLKEPEYADADALYADKQVKDKALFSVSAKKTISNQLRRLSEISAFLKQQKIKRQEDSKIPELKELEGDVNVTLAASNTLDSGILAQINLDGGSTENPWRWGEYEAQKVALRTTYKDNVLAINPLRVELGDSTIELSSRWGERKTANIKLENVSLDLVENFVDIPAFVTVGGGINGNVNLVDILENMQAIGALNIKNGTINQTPIQSANASFTYQDSRLDFLFSSLLTEKGDPLTVTGTFPYQLPLGNKPESDDVLLNVSIKNQGMILVNLLSRNQVNWIDGEGDAQLQVTGRFNQGGGGLRDLKAEGEALINQATITANALPDEPLTDVQGKILFNLDDIQVEELTGKFRQGEVAVAGNISLSQPIPQDNPLNVDLSDLAINLKGLYQGGVNGNLTINGSALEPSITGDLELSKGRVFLAESQGGGGGGGVAGADGEGFQAQFDNLELQLTDNIQITKAPILNFLAQGDLILTGTQKKPILDGTINLIRGQVNLFSAQFVLQGGYDNRAWFVPTEGLDPYLDVLLKTTVPETTRQITRTDPLSAEIADNPQAEVGGLQTVRIEAKVSGQASKISENLELTSSPQRSESEIVGLLGGRFVDTFDGGDTTLGLASLAGSAFLGNIQNTIGNALGLSEFRLFPTNVREEFAEESGGGSNSNFGLGAEVGVDIGRQFSLSVLKVINTQQPFQYGIRYRINDNLLFRGSTDLSDDSRGAFEYTIRF